MVAIEDRLHSLKTKYRKSPQWFKSTVGWFYSKLPYSVRYGPVLEGARSLLEQSQWWSAERLRSYQWDQLSALLEYAYLHVPYYRRVWSGAGVSPSDIQSFEDLTKLPLITKEIVRAHKEEFVANNHRDKLLPFNTGGSTGRPLEIYWERGRTRALERAFMWRQWRWAGFDYGEPTAVLRGQTIREGIHYDPIDNHLFLSSFDCTDATAEAYLAEMRRFSPISIQAYPSTITVLANYMKRHNEPPVDGLRVILCGSENLYAAQRALLEQVFQCRIYSWYGLAESVCLAGGCERSNLYHVYNEYGYAELIDQEGKRLDWKEGVKGEIVGTGFNNWAMPLIRYRTGDIAVVGPDSCACGRQYPLWQRIEGRKQEYIVGPDGKLVSLTAFIFGQHYCAFDKIKRLQIVQDHPGDIVLRLLVVSEWSVEDENRMLRDMFEVLGRDWEIKIEYVDRIELTARGKHRFVIQNLPLTEVWSGAQWN